MLIISAALLGKHLIDGLTGLPNEKTEEEYLFAVSLLNGDAPTRINWSEPAPAPLYYQPKINFSAAFDGSIVQIPSTTVAWNSMRIRDYEYTLEKPAGTYRIIILGGSFTFGWGVELDETFSKVLETRLNEKYGTKKHGTMQRQDYQVINFGIPGYTAVQEAGLFSGKAAQMSPDLVIIAFHPSDLKDVEYHLNLSEQYENNKSLRLANNITSEEELRVHISYLVKEHAKSVPFDELWNKMITQPYNDIAGLAAQKNISIILYSIIPDQAARPHLESEAARLNWRFVQSQVKYWTEEYRIHELDLHPNALAHEVYATELEDALLRNQFIT